MPRCGPARLGTLYWLSRLRSAPRPALPGPPALDSRIHAIFHQDKRLFGDGGACFSCIGKACCWW